MPLFKILSICKGGGYRYCRTEPPHPNRNAKGLYPLHRVLMENKIGRLLTRREHVHHKDEDKTNDSIENLDLLSVEEHARHHRPPNPLVHVQCPCGAEFKLTTNEHRNRLRRSKRGVLFCSIACSAQHQWQKAR